MSVAALVQLQIGLLHGLADPGAVGVSAWGCAGADHGSEIPVEGHFIALFAQQLAQAAGYVQLIREEHGARIGRPPEDGLAFREPGEAAMAIGLDQAIGR